MRVSNQLVSLASRECPIVSSPSLHSGLVSNQLVSLASREKGEIAQREYEDRSRVSNQLVSLASREFVAGRDTIGRSIAMFPIN